MSQPNVNLAGKDETSLRISSLSYSARWGQFHALVNHVRKPRSSSKKPLRISDFNAYALELNTYYKQAKEAADLAYNANSPREIGPLHIRAASIAMDIGAYKDAFALVDRALQMNPPLKNSRKKLLEQRDLLMDLPNDVVAAEAMVRRRNTSRPQIYQIAPNRFSASAPTR